MFQTSLNRFLITTFFVALVMGYGNCTPKMTAKWKRAPIEFCLKRCCEQLELRLFIGNIDFIDVDLEVKDQDPEAVIKQLLSLMKPRKAVYKIVWEKSYIIVDTPAPVI